MVTTLTTELTITKPLCRFDELADGHSRGFDPANEGRDSMFIVRQGDKLHAWRNSCPHYNRARMAWKKDEFLNGDKSKIMCGAHGAMFDIDTGLCTIGPCIGEHLTSVPVEVRDGQVWVVGPYTPLRPPNAGRHHD